MQLMSLLNKLLIKQIEGNFNVDIHGVEIDSRQVKFGDLFICLRGHVTDGHCFINDAMNRGAAAVLVDRNINVPLPVTKVWVPDTRRAMPILADLFYGHPASRLNLIGVTGTNGKTTTTHLIDRILNDSGKKSGLIGTIYMRIGDYLKKTPNTTPESLELFRYFNQMLNEQVKYAVLEVSSHGLEKGRVRGCDFKTAVFTNLTHDHLDYHRTMEQYRDAKGMLFAQLRNSYDKPSFAVLNADDPTSDYYAQKTGAQIITYGIKRDSNVQARDIEVKPSGVSFVVDSFRGSIPVNLKINGIFNVYNALAAISACLIEDISLHQIKSSLELFNGVEGRFETVYEDNGIKIIVDYAHNPDGLLNVLKAARKITDGKLYCICGCEGDRDKEKRPIMAKIAVAYSDFAILTSDNTRSEDPKAILQDMCDGLVAENISMHRYIMIENRRKAIEYAISVVQPNDCVIIAGKGHETHQIVRDRAIPFNDRVVVLNYIKEKDIARRVLFG